MGRDLVNIDWNKIANIISIHAPRMGRDYS